MYEHINVVPSDFLNISFQSKFILHLPVIPMPMVFSVNVLLISQISLDFGIVLFIIYLCCFPSLMHRVILIY